MKRNISDELFLQQNQIHLERLVNMLQVARTELSNLDLQLPMLLVFFEVAKEKAPGISMTQLEQRVGLSQAAVSRIVAKLGSGMLNQAGLNLIHAHENPTDRRAKLVELTPAGILTMSRLLRILKR